MPGWVHPGLFNSPSTTPENCHFSHYCGRKANGNQALALKPERLLDAMLAIGWRAQNHT
ncbi:hypothetical protein M2153_003950 [Pseudomonas sp. JUb96]|nr:hypothetical protein [Pseudomonas sp. JUb96]